MGLGAGQTIIFTIDSLSLGTGGQHFVHMPYRGRVISLHSRVNTVLTGADCIITAKIEGTLVVGLGFTITQSGSAVGDLDSDTPTAAAKNAAGGYFEAGEAVEVESNGGATLGAASFTLVVSAQDR